MAGWLHCRDPPCPRRCVELQPLCAAAHQALGLVAEARGDAAEAARELELALELIVSDDPHPGVSSLSYLLLVAVHSPHPMPPCRPADSIAQVSCRCW